MPKTLSIANQSNARSSSSSLSFNQSLNLVDTQPTLVEPPAPISEINLSASTSMSTNQTVCLPEPIINKITTTYTVCHSLSKSAHKTTNQCDEKSHSKTTLGTTQLELDCSSFDKNITKSDSSAVKFNKSSSVRKKSSSNASSTSGNTLNSSKSDSTDGSLKKS